MVVSFYSEREATVDFRLVCSCRRASQCTACQHGLLLLIETDGAELLPVADQLIFHNDFVNGEFSLIVLSAGFCLDDKAPTSLSDSIGTLISSAISLLPRKISPV